MFRASKSDWQGYWISLLAKVAFVLFVAFLAVCVLSILKARMNETLFLALTFFISAVGIWGIFRKQGQ